MTGSLTITGAEKAIIETYRRAKAAVDESGKAFPSLDDSGVNPELRPTLLQLYETNISSINNLVKVWHDNFKLIRMLIEKNEADK